MGKKIHDNQNTKIFNKVKTSNSAILSLRQENRISNSAPIF